MYQCSKKLATCREHCCSDHSDFPPHSMFTSDGCWDSLGTTIFGNSSSATSNTWSRLPSRLSSRFLWLCLELILARLNAYGLDSRSVYFLSSYLDKRKEITKVNSSYSISDWILFAVLPGSILGPLLFNIYVYHLFYQIERLDLAI